MVSPGLKPAHPVQPVVEAARCRPIKHGAGVHYVGRRAESDGTRQPSGVKSWWTRERRFSRTIAATVAIVRGDESSRGSGGRDGTRQKVEDGGLQPKDLLAHKAGKDTDGDTSELRRRRGGKGL